MTDRFKGIIAPLTTPFLKSGDLDWAGFEANITKYVDSPLAGVLALGTTGEAVHLSDRERVEVVKFVSRLVPENRVFMAGVSYPSVKLAVEFIEQIKHLRIDALLVSVPSYYKSRMGNEALTEYFEAVASASPHPILVYNIPKFSGIELQPSVVGRLAGHPNIIGMKDSSANMIFLQHVLRVSQGQDFQVLSGNAETIGLAMTLGVRAGILAVGCVVPELMEELDRLGSTGARSVPGIQPQLYRISSTVVGKLSVPGIKYGMDLRGFQGGYCRSPLLPLTAEEKREVAAVLEAV
ncbi:MAG: dihydrodipicolinate synthase family protein [Acidobacteriota bacterium]|nr:MAG: dihydrodipicolinate synthase family protein [Acidobacteriota bacterium]